MKTPHTMILSALTLALLTLGCEEKISETSPT